MNVRKCLDKSSGQGLVKFPRLLLVSIMPAIALPQHFIFSIPAYKGAQRSEVASPHEENRLERLRLLRAREDVWNDFPKTLWNAYQGDIEAQARVGVMFYTGSGTFQSYSEAFKWLSRAAEAGHAGAQTNLGICYAEGNGVDENGEAAIEWFTKAARKDHAAAFTNLGICFAKGTIVSRNLGLAYMWLTLAAEKHPSLPEAYLQEVKNSMTLDQIAEAEQLVKAWKSNPSNAFLPER